MKETLLAGCGGFLGAAARYQAGRLIMLIQPAAVFPWATLAVNLLGCFVIGLLAGLDERVSLLTPTTRVLLITGFLGGFTTFSAFGRDVILLTRFHQFLYAAVYIFVSVFGGILLVWLGYRIAGVPHSLTS